MKIKKILTIIITISTILTSSLTAFASESKQIKTTEYIISEVA